MRVVRAILVGGLLGAVVGCRSADSSALFSHTQWESPKDARSILDTYKHVLVVCIYEDHWEDRGPHRLSLHHFRGTVVRSYKGDWSVSEMVAIVHGADAPALKASNAIAGHLMFVFTNEHTDSEIGLDTGEFGNYDGGIDRALEFLYPKIKPVRHRSARTANKSLQATAAAPFGLHGLGDSRLPGFVLAQSPAAVPELARSAACTS